MSELRPVFFQYLTSPSDAARRSALETALASVDLVTARAEAKQDPGSGDAAAKVVGRMILDGAANEEAVDAAKVAAQRAPREGAGNDVALLAGMVVWKLGSPTGGSSPSAQAEPYFRRVRRNDPANPEVLAFYREMFAADSDASQLMQVLVQARRALKKDDTEPRFALAQEMADLAEKKLVSLDRAIEVWRSVLREDGYDPRAAKALERLYREGQKWTALVELLKEEYDRVPDRPETKEERITRLLEIAELYRDQLRLDAMALGMLQKILDINPRHAATIKALADTYGNTNRWNDLLAVYGRLLDAARHEKDVPRQVDMLRRIAGIWADQLANPSKAMELLADAMALAPGDRESRGMLARIHESRKDWRALIDLRRSELAQAEGEEALHIRVELARLAEERLGDKHEAIGTWREILDKHGDVDIALQALLQIYERDQKWSEVAEILRRKVGQASDDEHAALLLSRLADVHEHKLKQPDEAIRVWAEVARRQPRHERANAALRAAYTGAGRWDDLVALFEAQARLADVLPVLHDAAAALADPNDRFALYRRIATLARDRLSAPERGLQALEHMLALQPGNQAVAGELLPIYRDAGEWDRVLAIYEVQLSGASDDDDRLDLIATMRDIALQKLNSPRQALHWAGRAYQLRPGDEVLRAGLESVAERADGWDEVTRYFEARIASPECEGAERLELLDKLAVIARDRLGRPQEAQRYFRQILEQDPGNAAALTALEQIYTAAEQWPDLAGIVTARLEATQDPTARLATLRRLGALQEQRVGDLDAAIETYRQIQAQAPGDAEAADSLTRLYRARGRWAELAEVLQQRLDQGELSNEQIPLLFELSQIYATRLRSSQKAIAGFLQILDVEPDHLPTIDALEVLRRADPSSALAVMRGLLPYYRSIRDHGREAEAMEVIVMAEPDSAARTSQLVSLANLYSQMDGRKPDALRVRRELLVAQPEDAALRAEVEAAARELGRMDLVASAYEQMLAVLQRRADEAERQGRAAVKEELALVKDLLLSRGTILRDDLRLGEEAEKAFAAVLDRDETHQVAYEALEELLKMRGANEELMKLYRRRVDVVFDPEEQKRLLSRIVYIARDVLGQREVAIRTAEELLDLVPDDLKTMEQLAGMYELSSRSDDHYALEELLGRWAELVEGDELRHDLANRRAGLRMDKLSDAFGAVDLLGQVLGEDPSNPVARGLLERLLDHKDVQLQAAALLEPIYQGLKDHASRVRILHVRRRTAEDLGSSDEAIGHLLEIARIEEFDLDNAEAAFDAVREAYLVEPRRVDIRSELQRLGIQLEKQRELVEVWQRSLAKLPDPGAKIELLSRIAVVLDDHLQDHEGARKAYAELLALEPPDVELARRATVALARLHRAAGDAPALIETLRGLLRFTEKDADQVRINLEIAELQETRLGDLAAAASTYHEVLDIDPAVVAAMDALERIYVGQGAWEPLTRVLRQRVMTADDPFERARLWRKIGEILRDQLKNPYEAIEAFQGIVDAGASTKETTHAIDAIVRLNSELERWPEVEEGLRKLLELADADDAKAELLVRTAAVVGDKLGRFPDAVDLLEQVLRIAPDDERAREILTAYLGHEEVFERVIKILHPLYEAEQNWTALLDLEERRARHLAPGRARLLALLQVARTQEERLADPQRAFTVLCEALAEAGDQPELPEVLAHLERLGAEPERHEPLLDAYLKAVDNITHSDELARVQRAIGRIAAEKGRLDDARRAYERLLEADPNDEAGADALEQVLTRQGDHDALADLLVRRGERDITRRDDFFVRAAEIYKDRLSRPEDAIGLYERVDPEGAAGQIAQVVLGPLYEQTERWSDLARFLEARLPQQSGREVTETHLRLAQIHRTQLGNLGEGLRQFALALRHEPEFVAASEELERYFADEDLRPQVIEQLEPVFSAIADWGRLIRVQELRLAEAGEDTAQRVQILGRIAQIEEDMREDLEAAFATYQRVFKEDPHHRGAREQMTRLAHVLAKPEVLAKILTDYVTQDAAADESDDTLAVVRDAAELWAVGLDQPRQAVPLYERLIAARPADGTVFPALERALTRAEMWKELADAYWREADTSLDERRQVEVLMRLSELALGVLSDAEQAIKAFTRVLETQPEHETARGRLERVFEGQERWDALIESLRQRLERAEDPGSREVILLRIADLQDMRQDNPDAAIDTIEGLLAEQPGLGVAITALEQLAETREAQRVRLFAILRPIYEAVGDAMRLVAVDEWQLTQTEDPVQRHELYREIAALLEPQGDQGPAYAFQALVRALAEPGPEGALEALDAEVARVARQYGFDLDLRQALLMAAESERLQGDVARRVALMLQAAQLAVNAGDNEAAVRVLRQALEISPDDRAALALLDEALALAADFEGLRPVLERRIEVATDDEERIDLLRRLARLVEEGLGQPDAAELAWRRILDIEPNNTDAMLRLRRLYAAKGDHAALIRVLEQQIEITEHIPARQSLRKELARIHREGLGDRAAEIEDLRALLLDTPDDDDAMGLLVQGLLAVEDYPEAATAMLERVAVATRERRVGLLLEVARLFTGKMNDPISAMPHYESIFQTSPGHTEALGDLMRLVQEPASSEAAAALLIPQLEHAHRYAELAQVWEARSRLAESPGDAVEALRQLAKIRFERLGDIAGSLAANNLLMDRVGPDDLRPVLEASNKMSVRLDKAEDHVDALARRAARSDLDPQSRVMIAQSAADMAEGILGDRTRALHLLATLLDAGIADEATCRNIERLARAAGDKKLLARALGELAKLLAGQNNHADTLVRLGDAQFDVGDLPAATAAYAEALDDRPGFAGAVAGLERVLDRSQKTGVAPSPQLLEALDNAYHVAGNKPGLTKIARLRLEGATGAERVANLETLARLCDEGGGSAEEALDAWGSVLQLDAEHGQAIERVVALSRSPQLLVRGVKALATGIDAAVQEGRPCTALCIETTRILLRDLRRPDSALQALSPALKDNPDNLEALELQIMASRAAGNVDILHAALTRYARLSNNPDIVVPLLREAVTVAEAMADQGLALQDLRALIEVDQSDAAAWDGLLRQLHAAGDHEGLARALEQRIGITTDEDERRALRHQLANLLVHLGGLDEAIAVYGDMLAARPDDLQAIQELEHLHRRLKSWKEVRETLERKLDLLSGAQRVPVLEEMAHIAEEQLEDPDDAMALHRRLLAEAPAHTPSLVAMWRLLDTAEKWPELAELLEQFMAVLRDLGGTDQIREVGLRLAELYAERLGDGDKARQILTDLLAGDPDFVPAILALSTVEEQQGNDEAMRELLLRAQTLQPQGVVGAALQLRLAVFAEGPEKKREHLETALHLHPANVDAARQLLDLSRKEGYWEQVAYLLALLATYAEDDAERKKLILERVDILMDKVGDPEEALRALAPVYEVVQDDVEVNRRIADALFVSERYEEAGGMYGWLVEVAAAGGKRSKQQAHYLSRLARVELSAGNVDQALDRLKESYRIDTTNPETLVLLTDVYAHKQMWDESLKTARAMLLQNVDQSGLVRRGDIYMRLANAHVGLKEPQKAISMLRRGLEEDPKHPDIAAKIAEIQAS